MTTTLPIFREFISSDSTIDPRPAIVEGCLHISHERFPRQEELPALLSSLFELNISAIKTARPSVEKINAFNILKFFGLDLIHNNFSVLELELEGGTISLSIHQYKQLEEPLKPEIMFAVNLISYLILFPTLETTPETTDFIDLIESICSPGLETIPEQFRDSEFIELDIQGELRWTLIKIVKTWSISNTIRFLKNFPSLSSAQKTALYRRMDIIQTSITSKHISSLEDLVLAIFPSYTTRSEELFGFKFEPLSDDRRMREIEPPAPLQMQAEGPRFRALSFSSINNSPLPSPSRAAAGGFEPDFNFP